MKTFYIIVILVSFILIGCKEEKGDPKYLSKKEVAEMIQAKLDSIVNYQKEIQLGRADSALCAKIDSADFAKADSAEKAESKKLVAKKPALAKEEGTFEFVMALQTEGETLAISKGVSGGKIEIKLLPKDYLKPSGSVVVIHNNIKLLPPKPWPYPRDNLGVSYDNK